MKGSTLVLNKQNTMLYRKDNISLIKTYYKSIKVKLTKEEHEFLVYILKESITGKSLNDLLDISNKRDLSIIKLLVDLGSIYFYQKNDEIDRNKSKKWFSILSQFSPPLFDIHSAVKSITSSRIVFDKGLTDIFQDLVPLFNDYGLNTDVLEFLSETNNTDFVVTDKQKQLDIFSGDILLISFNNGGVMGTYKSGEGNKDLTNLEGIILKFTPIYILIYLVKNIAGITKNDFFINENGKFVEIVANNEEHYGIIPISQSPMINEKVSDLERIEGFEKFIEKNFFPLQIAGLQKGFSEINQIGLSVYGLYDTNSKVAFLKAGIDFEENCLSTIKNALKFHLSEQTNKEWLVSDFENYYLDKANLLLNYLDEESKWYNINQEILERIPVVRDYLSFTKNISFLIQHHQLSKSSTVYILELNTKKMFCEMKKTIKIEEQIKSTLVNYILFQSNQHALYNSNFRFVLPKIIDTELAINLDLFRQEEADYIEHALVLFKTHNIRYEEWSWVHEKEILSLNLIARMIEGGVSH